MQESQAAENGWPTRIAHFDVLEEIGRGAAAVVYKAHDSALGRFVALKVLHHDEGLSTAQRADVDARFRREAAAAANLSHPGIVTVYEFGEFNGTRYLAMELLEGQTLRDRISAGKPLSVWEALPLVKDICAALQFAHHQKLVHRDIKPDNIFLLENGRAKLTDFGIARHVDQVGFTHVGTFVGSPAYMSPEQIIGESVDTRSDVFSLGATIYEALAGWRPFDGDNIPIVVHNILYCPPRRMDDTPPLLEDAILKALEKQPSARYQSVRELWDAFTRASRHIDNRASHQPSSQAIEGADGCAAAVHSGRKAGVFWQRVRRWIPRLTAAAGVLLFSATLGACAGSLGQRFAYHLSFIGAASHVWRVPLEVPGVRVQADPTKRSAGNRSANSAAAREDVRRVRLPDSASPSGVAFAFHTLALIVLVLLAGWLFGAVMGGELGALLPRMPALAAVVTLLVASVSAGGALLGWKATGIERPVNAYNDALLRARDLQESATQDDPVAAAALRQFDALRLDPRVYRDYQPGALCITPGRIPRSQYSLGAGRLLEKRQR